MPLHTVDETLTFSICAAMNTGGCADPERLLSPPQIQLLQSPCVSLSVGPGLSSQHSLQICTLTSLTYLKLCFTKTYPERKMTGMPMDSLTKVQVLNELKLSFPPRLPLLLSKLANLESLTVAPRTAATLDMSSLTQVCSLRLGQGYLLSIYRTQTSAPVILPAGQMHVCQLLPFIRCVIFRICTRRTT